MPERPPEAPADLPLIATPETLSDVAARADLGPLDHQTALKIKLCELMAERRFQSQIATVNTTLAETKAKYIAVLRELRDALAGVKLDDLLKIVLGIISGLLIRVFAEQGSGALAVGWVLATVVIFAMDLLLIVLRLTQPSTRKREITSELGQETRND